MFFGFFIQNGEVLEQIPSIFKKLSPQNRRKIFITQFNAVVENDLKINTKSLDLQSNLFEIFSQKIESLLSEKHKSCSLSKHLINIFLQNKTHLLNHFYANMPLHPAAKLISMMFCKENKGIYFESSWFFCNYVFEKISRCHFDKEIKYNNGLIIVSKSGHDLIAIMPSFKYISTNQPYLANEEIQKAYTWLKKISVEKFYIAYPKNEDFRRHIIVKQNENDINSKLTLIPYAISHKIVYNNHSKIKNLK